jgi:hypothetical protein
MQEEIFIFKNVLREISVRTKCDVFLWLLSKNIKIWHGGATKKFRILPTSKLEYFKLQETSSRLKTTG